jgi:hypothetical protein
VGGGAGEELWVYKGSGEGGGEGAEDRWWADLEGSRRPGGGVGGMRKEWEAIVCSPSATGRAIGGPMEKITNRTLLRDRWSNGVDYERSIINTANAARSD